MTSTVRLKDKIILYFQRRFSERSVNRRSLRLLILSVLLVLSVGYASYDRYQKIKRVKEAVGEGPARLRILIEDGDTSCPSIFIFSGETFGAFGDVILCVWRYGRVVWSEDQLRGGPPYFEGKIPPKMVEEILDEIEDAGSFDDPFLNAVNLAVDPTLTIVALIRKNKVLCMEAARNRKGDGLEESEDYCKAYFRIRELLGSLIPAEGKAINFNYEIVYVFR